MAALLQPRQGVATTMLATHRPACQKTPAQAPAESLNPASTVLSSRPQYSCDRKSKLGATAHPAPPVTAPDSWYGPARQNPESELFHRDAALSRQSGNSETRLNCQTAGSATALRCCVVSPSTE